MGWGLWPIGLNWQQLSWFWLLRWLDTRCAFWILLNLVKLLRLDTQVSNWTLNLDLGFSFESRVVQTEKKIEKKNISILSFLNEKYSSSLFFSPVSKMFPYFSRLNFVPWTLYDSKVSGHHSSCWCCLKARVLFSSFMSWVFIVILANALAFFFNADCLENFFLDGFRTGLVNNSIHSD